MKLTPTLHVDLRAPSGRRTFELSLASFTEEELLFLVQTFANAEKGSAVDFNVGKTEDGRHCMQFVIGKPAFIPEFIPSTQEN